MGSPDNQTRHRGLVPVVDDDGGLLYSAAHEHFDPEKNVDVLVFLYLFITCFYQKLLYRSADHRIYSF